MKLTPFRKWQKASPADTIQTTLSAGLAGWGRLFPRISAATINSMPASSCPACLQPNADFSKCPHCGWCKDESRVDAIYLRPGTVIFPPYRVARVLGHGGFGITYLGWDANLEIKVAIKEYLPREFASRDPRTGQVFPSSGEAQADFQAGLNQFLDEARALAKFQQHPGIVSVLSFFPAFGTGYMVMEYVEGETLKNYLYRCGRLSWTQTLDIFMHVMDALRAVHRAGLLHRDIAPDNIYLCNDGRIKLLDFGAVQAHVGQAQQKKQALAVMVKPGFAPEEQYRDYREQGPWSDVYSVAASMYFCLTGQAPPDALDRAVQDSLRPPSSYGAVIPIEAEQILLSALAVASLQRPQSIESLQNQFLNLKSRFVSEWNAQSSGQAQAEDALVFSTRAGLIRLGIFHGWLGILIGGLLLVLILLMFWPNRNKPAEIQPMITQDDSTTGIEHHESPAYLDQEEDMKPQQGQEPQVAEELKQQQAEALKRFEERRQQESNPRPQPANQPDPRHLEHLRSLCAEWGATMDCKDLR